MRQTNIKAIENETAIIEALDAIKFGTYKNASEASRALGISRTTLYRRVKGNPSRSSARVKQQLLTEVEENTLVKYIQQLTRVGYPLTYGMLRELVVEIKKNHDALGASPTICSIKEIRIGQDWIPRFIKRHPRIKSVIGRRIEANRMEGIKKDTLNAYFAEIERTIKHFNIDKSNIYNMDETGFSIGTMESTRIIVDSTARTHWQAHPGRQEWVTVVECICADGTMIDPFVIFKGATNNGQKYAQDLPGWTFTSTEKGWTSNYHGLEWLTLVFDAKTRDRANGQTRLLICDGHGSHVTGGFLTYCMKNDIQLIVLPPHSSHILQPLDVAIFGPLKKALTRAMQPYHYAQVRRIQKNEWIQAYAQARRASLTEENIRSGWRGAGLVPFDPKKALRFLSPEPAARQVNEQMAPTTPKRQFFPSIQLASSSPELGPLHQANLALQESVQILATPQREHCKILMTISERRSTRRILGQHRDSYSEKIQNSRKEARKGKRAILKGKYRLTQEVIVDEVQNAEEVTSSSSKAKRQKTTTKTVERHEIDLKDVKMPTESNNDKINDCIVLAIM